MMMTEESNPLTRYLAVRIERWLKEHPEHTAADLANLAGITPTQVSTLRRGKRGAGMKSLLGLSRAFKTTLAALESEAEEWAKKNPPKAAERRVEYEPSANSARGSIRHWDKAEQLARDRFPGVPEEAWVGARGVSGFAFPDDATPELVWQLAMDWMRIAMLRKKK